MAEVDFYNLLKKSWNEYRDNFKLASLIYLLLYIIPTAMFYSLIFLSPYFKSGEPAKSVFFAVLFIILYVAYLAVILLNTTAFYYLFIYNKKGRMSFNDAVKGGMKYYLRFLGLALVKGLALLALFILFVIPGIIFSVYWAFSSIALVGENKAIIESMKKSKEVVKGKWWSVFGYLLLFFLLISVISSVVMVVGLILGVLLTLIIAYTAGGNILVSAMYAANIIYMVLIMLVNAVAWPMSILFAKNFYMELKK